MTCSEALRANGSGMVEVKRIDVRGPPPCPLSTPAGLQGQWVHCYMLPWILSCVGGVSGLGLGFGGEVLLQAATAAWM